MQTDKRILPFAIIIVGIILLSVGISKSGRLGVNISMPDTLWAGCGITAIGTSGLLLGGHCFM